jgi:excisionase family DNA binding protein
MEHIERLLTPQELAKAANISAATIKREVERGRLRALRIGTGQLVRIPESAWQEYLQRAGATCPASVESADQRP